MPAYQFDTDYGTLEFEHEGDPNELIPQVNQWVEAQKTAAAAALQNPGTQLETPPDFSAQLRQEDQPDAGGFDYALDLPARALSSVAEAGVNLVRGGLGVAGAAASSAADKLVRSGVPGIQSTILDLPFLGDDAKKMLAVAAGRAGQRVVGGYDAASSRTMDASTGKITGEDRPGGARGLTAVADTLKDAQRIGGEAVKQTVTALFQPFIEQTDTPTLPQKVASNAGTLATTVAAGVAAGPAGAMVAGGLSEFQDSYDRAVNLGVKPDDAYEGAVAAAAMKMPLEAIGSLPVASAFAKLAKGIRSTATTAQRAAKVGGQMLTEGVTEWTQALADQKVEDWFDYAKKTPETERAKERFESFVIGMVLGGGVSSIAEGVDYAKEKSGLPMTDEQKAKLAADIEARTTTPPDSASAAAPPDGPKPPPPPTAAEIALRAEQLRAKEAADNLRATAAATAEVLPASAAALRAKALAIEAEAESKAMEAARQRQAMDTERRKSASEDEQFRLAQEAEMARQNSSEATAPATKGQESIPPSAKEAAPPISEPTSPEPPSQAIATPAAAPEVKVGDVIEAKSHQINGLTHRGTVVSVHGNEIGMVNQDGAPVLVLRENVATPKPTSPAPQPRQSAGTAAQERAPEATSQTGGETLAQDTSVRDASKESGIHSVYEMDRRGEKKWMVQASDKRGFGDWIFDTKEEAEKASAVERTNAEQRAESQRRIAAKEAAEAKAKAEREDLDGFDAEMTPMKRGSVVKQLTTRLNYRGTEMTRRDLIRKMVNEGRRIETEDGERRLINERDEFLSEKVLTKAGLDYAAHLITNRPSADTGAAPASESPAEPQKAGGAGANGDLTLKGQKATDTTKPKRTFKRKIPEAPGGIDVIDRLIAEVGKIMHPETARHRALHQEGKGAGSKTTGRGGEFDQFTDMPPDLRNLIFREVLRKKGDTSGGLSPDQAAQAAYEQGLITNPSPDTLAQALRDAWTTRLSNQKATRAQERAAKEQEKTAAAQDAAFAAESKQPQPGAEKLPASSLNEGDVVEVNGETMKVTNYDPDTGTVTLEDGARYGVQNVEDNDFVYGEIIEMEKEEDPDWAELEDTVDSPTKAAETGASESLVSTEVPLADLSPENGQDGPVDEQGQEGATGAGAAAQGAVATKLPQLRPGKASDDLLQGENDVFNLVSETATEKAARLKREREEEAAKAAKESAEAKALQDKQQLDIFNQPPPVVESPREATPVVESETPKGEAQKLTRAQSEKLQVDAYNIADSIAQSVAQGQPDSVIEAAAIAAYQNALASIESSGQFNPGFMRKSAMTAAGKEAAKLGTSLDAPIGDSETTGKDMVESAAATPDQEAQAADTRALVDEALATMPERERRIIEETEAGTPDDVIAEAMGITQGSVRTIRSRARKTLAAKLSAKLGKMIDGTKNDPTKLHFDPLFIESVGKPALRIALRVFKAAVDAGAPILDAIERAILSLRDNAKRWTPELEAQARQFFKPLNEADASTLPKPPKPLPTVPGSGVPPKPPKPLPKVPGSTVPPDSTGLTEERTNLERAARGLEPVAKDEPITNEDTLANGQAVLAANPSRALEVMEELRTAPPEARTISREDGAVLVVEKRRLVNMRDAAAKRVNDESLSPEARSVARNEWDAFEAQIGAMDQAAQDARSVWGGFGQMWQRMLRDDFTFDALERKARVNRGGRGLTKEEFDFFEQQAAKIAKLEEQVAANQQAAEDLETAQEVAATYEQTIKDLQGELDARPKFGKEVLDAAQRVVNRWKAEAETARSEMRKEMGFASAIPIPTKTIAYLAKMIRAKIGELGLKQAEISAELLSEFGDQIKPYLNRAWKQAQKLIGKEGMPPKVRAKVRAGMKKKGEKPPVDVLARAKAESLAGEELSHRTVYELARAHINAGIHGEEAVMKAVHADLAPLYDGLTERDVRRAFSEYGKVKYPSREATAKELSELRTLTRLQESIDRETAGLDAMHSGLQRDKATQAVREKQKVLNELLKNRKGPPSAQALTSRDEAKQTALRNRIADIDKELRTGIAPPKSTAAPDSDAVQTLKAERDAMLEKLRDIQAATNPPKTEAEKQIEQLQKQRTRISEILAGTRDPAKPKDWNPLSAAADDIKAEILAMQELAAQMRRDARPPTDPQAKIEERQIRALERAIERYRLRTGNRDISSRGKTQGPDTRRVAALKEVLASRKAMYELVTRYQRYNSGRAKWIESQIAAAEARIAAKDFAPRPKRVPQQESAENARARFKLDQLKQEILRGEFEYLQTQRTRMQRAMDTALQISNLRRALMTGGEMSGVLRQGGLIVLGSPLGGLRAFSQSIASLLSSEGEFQINDAIRNDADAALAKQAGLFLHDERAMDLRMIEEQAQSKWAEKIPWISHTQRFYTSFLNQLRMNAFKEEMDALRKKKGYVPMADAKAIAHAINVFTGRGKFSGRPAKPGGDPTNPGAGEVINSVAFAARFVMSRFQAATLQPLWGADSRNASGAARAQVAKRYARFAAGYLALQYGIALLKGFEDHGDDEDFWDWRSSRFGKVKVGKSWVDLTSGLGTVITLLGRLSTGEIKANSGKIIPISGPESGGFGQSDQWKVLADFARGKLAPNIQTILEFTSGKDFRSEPVPVSRYGIGDKEDVTKYAVKQVTPITAWDIAKVLEGENIPRETALSIAAFFGLGVNTYDEKPKKDNRPANPARKSQREASIRRNAEAASR